MPSQANLLGLDYREEATRLGPPVAPIIDVHTHINGGRAAAVYRDVCDLYGVERCYSMSQLAQADAVKAALGERVRFIAVPDYMSEDKGRAFREGFLENITAWHERGSRICKFWCAPRARDYGAELGDPRLLTLESPWREKHMDHAASLGMMFMVHIADPDTWFATKYADASRYGTKRSQYEPLERLMDQYERPWLLAHMGGWPEDLDFLTGLLERHPNAHLDCSATKWMVRELSRHEPARLGDFLERFRGRVLFGSDIVTTDLHLSEADDALGRGGQASGEAEAFELYASRYWALRTLLETSYDGPSPIADPDLHMVEPEVYGPEASARLRGHGLGAGLLRALYRDSAVRVIDAWHEAHA